MKKPLKNLIDVLMHFSDNTVCKNYLEQRRWNGKVKCTSCGHGHKIYRLKNGYKCSDCKKQFSVVKGTIFENSQIPLQKWFGALWLMSSHKKGISSVQLSKDLGITQKSAWFMLQRLRNAFENESFEMPLSNIVEVDETYVGGKNKNRHADKKFTGTQGRSNVDKTPVFGMLERGGRVVAMKVANVSSKELQPIIDANVDLGSHIMSDEWTAYTGLSDCYDHSSVNHGASSYVIGNAHTNTLEGFWSIFKRGIFGIYHCVSRKHMDKYVSEFEFRYNNRDMSEIERFNKVLSICDSRISYKELIKKGVFF
jgi:transposase-like protein